jgi:glycine dehydrogenase
MKALWWRPTESESKQELDWFIDMMIAIKGELEDIKNGKADKADNLIANAPHTALRLPPM